MAEDKKKNKSAVARLTPNSIDVKLDGDELRVPMDKQENAIFNMIMAAQLRHRFQAQLKDYQENDMKFTPKELADLAKAARDIAAFSAEVYSGTEPITPKQEKQAEPAETIDFDKVTPQITGVKTE